MKESLERKINAYRQAKTTKQSFDGFIEEKKKTLQTLIQQQALEQQNNSTLFQLEKDHKYSSTYEFGKKLEIKQQEYFRQMKELQQLKLQAIDKQDTLEQLKINLFSQRAAYQQLKQSTQHKLQQAEQVISKTAQNHANKIKQIKQVYQQRRKNHLQHIQQLINAKEQQNQLIQNFLNKKKKFQKDQKQLKENHEKTLKQNKKLWAQQQLENKQKWEKQKKLEIDENTLKGIEPEIQRIISSSKAQIKKIQEKYQIANQQYRAQQVKQYERRATQLRNESFAQVEQEKMKILAQYSQKLSHQFEALEQQFERDRKKIRAQRQEEIKQLEEKRRNETEDFIINNKDFYSLHLQEVKSIKQEYEQQIKELDGKYEMEIEKEEHLVRVRYNDKLQAERESRRKELEQKIKAFTGAYEKECEGVYEDIVEKVAVQNDIYETQVKAQTDEKIKQIRENHDSEIKKTKKTIQLLQTKLASLSKQITAKRQQREQSEQALEEMKRQNDHLQRQITSHQNDLMQKKLNIQNNADIDHHPSVKSLNLQWQEQITNAKEACLTLEKEVEQVEEIMAEKIAQLRNDYSENVNLLERNSLKLLTLKKNELAKLKAEKEMQENYAQGLEEMLKKQKAMLEKYQEKKTIANSKRSSTTK